eukprot:9948829-Alexandrium_andersonii.AAC.1
MFCAAQLHALLQQVQKVTAARPARQRTCATSCVAPCPFLQEDLTGLQAATNNAVFFGTVGTTDALFIPDGWLYCEVTMDVNLGLRFGATSAKAIPCLLELVEYNKARSKPTNAIESLAKETPDLALRFLHTSMCVCACSV